MVRNPMNGKTEGDWGMTRKGVKGARGSAELRAAGGGMEEREYRRPRYQVAEGISCDGSKGCSGEYKALG